MNSVMKQALQEFNKIHGIYPMNVIVYRDGVSASQQQGIKDIEATAIRNAMNETAGCENSKLIFVCVNKKVNSRFYV